MAKSTAKKTQSTELSVAAFLEGDARLAKLGNVKSGKGCLYIKSLEDVDTAMLEKRIAASFKSFG